MTAANLFDKQQKSDVGLVTFSAGLDLVLGDGLLPGQITELTGQAGSGKTQLCLQLCANVQLPPLIGGLGGKVVYIGTGVLIHTVVSTGY